MPTLTRDDGTTIHYTERGAGYPLLTFAPGGMRSAVAFWERSPFNPLRELADEFRVIAMDQRNAGASRAPITAQDGWHSYAADHLALLDHLGIQRCHVLGGCIGGAFALRLSVDHPERVSAAVLQQPIGLSPTNRSVFYELFDSWSRELPLSIESAGITPAILQSFRENMYGGSFVFSVQADVVRTLPTPLLVLMGNDVYHPSEISREIVALSPHAKLIESWKEPEVVPQTVREVRAFLRQHTP